MKTNYAKIATAGVALEEIAALAAAIADAALSSACKHQQSIKFGSRDDLIHGGIRTAMKNGNCYDFDPAERDW